jgi:hypothetical protein
MGKPYCLLSPTYNLNKASRAPTKKGLKIELFLAGKITRLQNVCIRLPDLDESSEYTRRALFSEICDSNSWQLSTASIYLQELTLCMRDHEMSMAYSMPAFRSTA